MRPFRIVHAFLAAACALLGGLAHAPGAGAQDYPSKQVVIVVPFLAGGAVDVFARIVAAKLAEYWGRPVLVENRPGAGGNLGTNSVATSEPDGHTLVFAPHGPLSYNKSLYANVPYDPATAFAPIALIGRSPNFLIVARESKVNSLADLVAAAKSDPGKITYASQGIGTTPHLTGAYLGVKAGIDIVHVPYRGFPPAVTDLISQRVSFMFADSGNTLPQLQNKSVRVLAIAGNERWKTLPDVKTMIELGYPGFVSVVWYALAAPAKTPRGVIDRIHADLVRVLKDPGVAERLGQLGVEIVGSTPAEAGRVLAEEAVRWGEIINAAGLKQN